MVRLLRALVLSFVVCAAIGVAARGQVSCLPSWEALSTPGVVAGLGSPVHAVLGGDDPTAPTVAFGGAFATAGGIPVGRLATFDGVAWAGIGGGVNGTVRALARFDDGGGTSLFAGGDFTTAGPIAATRVARFDGASWFPLGGGVNGAVRAFAVFDDGFGPKLYAGGSFTSAGGVPCGRIARWDGVSWTAAGGGFDADVLALAVYDDGSGPRLIAGGTFSLADGAPASRIAAFDGVSWTPLGAGVAASGGGFAEVATLVAGDAGEGPRLYAGGSFATAGGVSAANMAAWDGASWSTTGAACSAVRALTIHPVGGTPRLHAALVYTDGFGVSTLGAQARMGGPTAPWTIVGTWGTPITQNVYALASIDAGGTPILAAVGDFSGVAGNGSGVVAANHAAYFDGVRWQPFGAGLAGTVRRLKTLDLGSGPECYAGGYFPLGGGAARLSVGGFAAFAPDLFAPTFFGVSSHAADYAVFDDGGGPALYATGYFVSSNGTTLSHVAKLGASGWTPLGLGITGFGYALAVYDDGGGPALYVGGSFSKAGGLTSPNLAKWDGAAWTPIGGLNGAVGSLQTFDDGSGPALYVGGVFTTAGGVASPGLVRYRGGAFETLGSGLTGFLGSSGFAGRSLQVFDDGGGPKLYVAGNFTHAGGVLANGIARWNGVGFEGLAGGFGGVSGDVEIALASYATLTGPILVAIGPFSTAGGVAATKIAAFNGSTWSPLANTGASIAPTAPLSAAIAITAFDDGLGAKLYVGGGGTAFTGGVNLARWTDPVPGILDPPRGASVPSGAPFSFVARPTGRGPFTFQWNKDGSPIPGETGPTFARVSAAPSDAGIYDVSIIAACGAATSAAFPLWVSTFGLALSKPYGPGSIRVANSGGPSATPYIGALTFDPRNVYGLGAGNLCGLFITDEEFWAEVLTFQPPFFGFFDAAGASLFELPAGFIPPALFGLKLHAATVAFDPVTLLPTACSNPASLVL